MAVLIFAVIFLLLMPLAMIICGAWFIKSPPEPDSGIGYRTSRSMSSPAAWIAAHSISGKYWLISGLITLIGTLLGGGYAILSLADSDDAIYNVILIAEGIQLFFLLLVIPITEFRLKKMFHI